MRAIRISQVRVSGGNRRPRSTDGSTRSPRKTMLITSLPSSVSTFEAAPLRFPAVPGQGSGRRRRFPPRLHCEPEQDLV